MHDRAGVDTYRSIAKQLGRPLGQAALARAGDQQHARNLQPRGLVGQLIEPACAEDYSSGLWFVAELKHRRDFTSFVVRFRSHSERTNSCSGQVCYELRE